MLKVSAISTVPSRGVLGLPVRVGLVALVADFFGEMYRIVRSGFLPGSTADRLQAGSDSHSLLESLILAQDERWRRA